MSWCFELKTLSSYSDWGILCIWGSAIRQRYNSCISDRQWSDMEHMTDHFVKIFHLQSNLVNLTKTGLQDLELLSSVCPFHSGNTSLYCMLVLCVRDDLARQAFHWAVKAHSRISRKEYLLDDSWWLQEVQTPTASEIAQDNQFQKHHILGNVPLDV